MRSATIQFGYLTGSLVGGTALALGGYPALGTTIGALFIGAALVVRPSGAPVGEPAPGRR